MKCVEDDKPPGVDEYNVIFYKKAWSIINNEVIETINQFFETRRLYKAINCTSIILIPKAYNSATIKEYRQITCWTILYKIIGKILAGKMQQVISTITSEAWARFISRSKVSDNIILAHKLI